MVSIDKKKSAEYYAVDSCAFDGVLVEAFKAWKIHTQLNKAHGQCCKSSLPPLTEEAQYEAIIQEVTIRQKILLGAILGAGSKLQIACTGALAWLMLLLFCKHIS